MEPGQKLTMRRKSRTIYNQQSSSLPSLSQLVTMTAMILSFLQFSLVHGKGLAVITGNKIGTRSTIECFNQKGICGGFYIPVSGPWYLGFGIFLLIIFTACFILVLIKTCYPKFKQVCFNNNQYHESKNKNFSKNRFCCPDGRNQDIKSNDSPLISDGPLIGTSKDNANGKQVVDTTNDSKNGCNGYDSRKKPLNVSKGKMDGKVGIPKKTGSLGRVRRNYYHRSSCVDYNCSKDRNHGTTNGSASNHNYKDKRTREWLLNNGPSLIQSNGRNGENGGKEQRHRSHSLAVVPTSASIITTVSTIEVPKAQVANGKTPTMDLSAAADDGQEKKSSAANGSADDKKVIDDPIVDTKLNKVELERRRSGSNAVVIDFEQNDNGSKKVLEQLSIAEPRRKQMDQRGKDEEKVLKGIDTSMDDAAGVKMVKRDETRIEIDNCIKEQKMEHGTMVKKE